MSLIACSVGFASCKTFGKQPKHPCFGAKPPTGSRGGSPSNIAPARMPGVYAQGLCTMQSQPSIHSLSPGERGFRQGCRNKDTPSFKHGCLQVVEQSRCRTHRQQTTTVAQMQSHQSVLKGIGIINQKFISKTDFFYKLVRTAFAVRIFIPQKV